MKQQNFWPLDFDPEGEIYENLAWDLPGYTRGYQDRNRPRKSASRTGRAQKEVR